MKVQHMARPRCICREHILPFDSWNSQWQPGMSLITVVWATRVRLHHASQLTKVGSWQILQWSCCWSVVSGKWGLTKLQLCHSSSVGCLQTVHDWSTVGPLAHSLFQIKIIAGYAVPSSPPSKLLFCPLWEMLLPRPAPGSTAALQSLSLPGHHCDRCH